MKIGSSDIPVIFSVGTELEIEITNNPKAYKYEDLITPNFPTYQKYLTTNIVQVIVERVSQFFLRGNKTSDILQKTL